MPGALIFYHPWKERLRNPATLALVCWFTATFLFFSASKSKIAYYLLPLLPSLALFIGSYLSALLLLEQRQGNHWRWTGGILYLLASILGLSGALAPIVVYKLEKGLFAWSILWAVIFISGALCMFLSLQRKWFEALLFSMLALWLGTSLVASVGILPYLDGYKSPRPLGEFIRFHLTAESPVYVFKSTMADFNYYARRETIPVVNSVDDVTRFTLPGRNSYLLVDDKDLKQFEFDARFNVVTEHQIGEKKWYLLRLS